MPLEKKYNNDDGYGLKILSDPEKPIADIVFIHGLTGDRVTTWTSKSKPSIFWPATLLRDNLEESLLSTRLITFGYDASVVRFLDAASSNRLRDHGKSLAEELAMMRIRTRTNTRPVIFVAHSLGGLVVEQALLVSRGSAESHVRALLESAYGILFLGTPHHGSDKANWASMLSKICSVLRHTNEEILHLLAPNSEVLAALQQEFHMMMNAREQTRKRPLEIFCFYEELPMQGVGKIVPMKSAILERYGSKSIHADHVNMTRFSSPDQQGFRDIADRIWLWLDAIQTNIDHGEDPPAKGRSDEVVQHHGTVDNSQYEQRPLGPLVWGTINSSGGPVFQNNRNVTATFQ